MRSGLSFENKWAIYLIEKNVAEEEEEEEEVEVVISFNKQTNKQSNSANREHLPCLEYLLLGVGQQFARICSSEQYQSTEAEEKEKSNDFLDTVRQMRKQKEKRKINSEV